MTAVSRLHGRAEREAALDTAAPTPTPPPTVCTCAICGGNPGNQTSRRKDAA